MTKLRKYLNKSFVRNSIIMVTATIIAQSFPVIAYPILTRLYSPKDFGVFSLYITTVTTLGLISGFRYETAIVLPKEEKEGISFFIIAVIIALNLNILLFITLPVWKKIYLNLINEKNINNFLIYIPITSFLLFLFNAFNFYYIRYKKYKFLAFTKILRSIFLVIIQIIGGVFKILGGLIYGFIISYFFTVILLQFNFNFKKAIQNFDLAFSKKLIKKYSKFPKYYLPSTILDSGAYLLLNFMIPFAYNIEILGLYSLAYRILTVPITFISKSLSQVFYQEFSDSYKDHSNFFSLYKKFFKNLFVIILPIYLLLFFTIKPFMSIIFGKEWEISGIYMQIITPLMLLVSLYSPLSMILIVLNKQNWYFLYQLLKNLIIIIIFLIAKKLSLPFTLSLILYSTFSSILLIFIIIVIHKLTKQEYLKLKKNGNQTIK